MNVTFEKTAGKDEWLTPPEIVKALGVFDLDPCAPVARPWDTALNHFTIEDDGLAQPWFGRVWLNPPYGDAAPDWLKKMTGHNVGTALTFARTETAMFFDSIWDKAHAVKFIKRRLTFWEYACKTCGRGRSKHAEPGKSPTAKQEKHDYVPNGSRVVEGEESAGAPSVLAAYGYQDADILASCAIEGKFIALIIRFAPELRTTWRQLVRWMMNQCGGVCTLEQLYELAKGHPKAEGNPNFKAKIRQQVQAVAENVGPGKWRQNILFPV